MTENPSKELETLLAEQARLTARQREIEKLLKDGSTPLADLRGLTQERTANEQILAAIGPRIATIRAAIQEQRERENAARVLALRPREFKVIEQYEARLVDLVKATDDCKAMAAEIGVGARCIPSMDLERLVRHYAAQIEQGVSVRHPFNDWAGGA